MSPPSDRPRQRPQPQRASPPVDRPRQRPRQEGPSPLYQQVVSEAEARNEELHRSLMQRADAALKAKQWQRSTGNAPKADPERVQLLLDALYESEGATGSFTERVLEGLVRQYDAETRAATGGEIDAPWYSFAPPDAPVDPDYADPFPEVPDVPGTPTDPASAGPYPGAPVDPGYANPYPGAPLPDASPGPPGPGFDTGPPATGPGPPGGGFG